MRAFVVFLPAVCALILSTGLAAFEHAGGPATSLRIAPPQSQQPQAPAVAPRTGGLRQIMPGHYVYIHTDDAPGVSSTFNSGIIVTSEGVVVVDALSSEPIARQVREAIARVTSQPVRMLVSSTFHERFTGGNAVYRDALRIGQENYRAGLLGLLQKDTPDRQNAKLPQVVYRDRLTLFLGGKEIRLLHLGRAHTNGDTVVFVPADRIVYASEVFNYDEFPYTSDGYPTDWIKTLEVVEALDADVFVPGHGFLPDNPRDTRSGLRAHRQLLADVRDAVQKEIARGSTLDQAVANIELPQYRRFKGYSRAMKMAVERTYKQLTSGLE